MFSVWCNLQRLSVCTVLSFPVPSLSLWFLKKLNGIMQYRPKWAILCFQTPPQSTVCILEQTQINTFNRQAISLPVFRSACPMLNTVAYKHRTYCPIWNWSGTHILSCEDAVGRMLHWAIPNLSLHCVGTTKTALMFLWTQRFWPLASATAWRQTVVSFGVQNLWLSLRWGFCLHRTLIYGRTASLGTVGWPCQYLCCAVLYCTVL